ncbi:MAG TPA: CocE/NonD family hydrolase, partial [Puia sp.]|nr:CocE/NonD family hydrolase [Puia sp.]
MKKTALLVLLTGFNFFAFSQIPDSLTYVKTSYMIPMRDGILLNTVVLTPVNNSVSYPFLIVRTPYGVDGGLPDGNQPITIHKNFSFYNMAVEGYIFVSQDIRGKYKSQGTMQIHQPLIHQTQKGAIDESTDTW